MKLYARRGYEWAEDGLVGLWCPVLTGATQGMLLDCNPSTSNHGALVNYANVNAGWAGSQFGTVVDFDGINDYIDLGLFYSRFVQRFTISAWVLNKTAPSTNTSKIILGWGSDNIALQGIFLKVDNNSGSIAYVIQKSQLGSNSISTVLPRFQAWSHLVLICIDTTVIFYTNNILNLQQTFGSTVQSSSSFFLGGRAANLPCDMQVADACMWNRVLERKEVEALYQAGPGGMWQDRPRRSRVYFSAAGFKAYWARRQSQLIGGGV